MTTDDTATIASPPPGTPLLSVAGLRAALGRDRPVFLVCVLLNLVSTTAGAAAAALAAWAVSRAVLGESVDQLWPVAWGVAGCVVARAAATWLESWLSHDLSFRMMSRVRAWIFASLTRIAPSGLARRRVGDVVTTALADSEALEIFYAHSSIYIAAALVTTPVLVAGLAVVDPVVALAVVPVVVLTCVAPALLRRAALRQGRQIRELIAKLGAETAENLGAVREIVGFGLTADRERRLRDLDTELGRLQVTNARRAGLETGIGGVVAMLGVLTAGVVGAWRLGSGELAPELLAPAMTLAGQTPAALLQLLGVTRHSGTTDQAARRIAAILYAPAPVDRGGTAPAPGSGAVDLEADEVSFTWPTGGEPADRPTVDGVSLRVGAARRVAVAGRSGAGKSTLAAVLARFVDPDDGTVRAGGVDVRALAPAALAETVCLVPQDVYLFHDTVRANLTIAAGDRTAPDDDALWAALETAQAADLVRALPDGLDTVVGERGATLSGGERQRLALARAVLVGSRSLVLDESVSQLDVGNEQHIRDALTTGPSGRTTVVIAHRLSTLLAAERIIVMDRGRIVGDGTHHDLLADCQTYRELVGPQLEAVHRLGPQRKDDPT